MGEEQDASPEARRAYYDEIRRMTPQQKLQRASEMTEEYRRRLRESIRHSHPEYTEEQVHLEMCRQLWGEELFQKVCAWRRERGL
jgi:hypothetical protein